jgi:hypothetical protein
MAITLVGSEGSVATSATNSITPAIPQSTTAGNLLVGFVTGNGGVNLTTASSGWLRAAGAGGGAQPFGCIFYKLNCGAAEADPTFAADASATWMRAKVNEFTAGASMTWTMEFAGSGGDTVSPSTVFNGGSDALAGDLVVSARGFLFSIAVTPATMTETFNNGATATGSVNDKATSSTLHYSFGSWGITTSAAQDSATVTFTATSLTGVNGAMASFYATPVSTGFGVPRMPRPWELLKPQALPRGL